MVWPVQTKPGPGAYHPTLTFAEELEKQRYVRAATRPKLPGSPNKISPRKLAPLAAASS